MCLNGQIPGATKLGREWAVLSEVELATDGRVTTREYKDWRKKIRMTFCYCPRLF